MAIDQAKLLALKAFYMGHAIAQKHAITATAMAMIDSAISHLKCSSESTEQLRLAFYYLLRAEVLRHGGTPTGDRREAQQICETIRSALYDHFMTIESATQSTKRLEGIQTLYIVDEGIKQTGSYWASDGWNSWVVRYDIASRALRIRERDFTEKERYFLEKVTLKDMLDKHGIKYAT